jgi:hypothetical protein
MKGTREIEDRPISDLIASGERLGFYDVMSEQAVTADELAERTGASIRLASDWLADRVREGYVNHNAETGRYANWVSLNLAA